MILVVGGTGVLGQRVVRLLLAEGHRVRVMSRDPARAALLAQQGADIVAGDLADPPSLDGPCRGASRVLAVAHSMMGRGRNSSEAVDGRGHRALIDAALAQGARRFVYTSALGAAQDHPIDFFRTKYAIERYLERSGLDYAIFRPSAFMEWHAHALIGQSILQGGRTVIIGTGTKPRNFVAASDVAYLAADALTSAAVEHRILEVGGPGNFSNLDVARLYSEFAKVAPRIVRVPRIAVSACSRLVRPLHPGVGRVMRLASLRDSEFPETFDAARMPRDLDIQFMSLPNFIRSRVESARSQAVPDAYVSPRSAPTFEHIGGNPRSEGGGKGPTPRDSSLLQSDLHRQRQCLRCFRISHGSQLRRGGANETGPGSHT